MKTHRLQHWACPLQVSWGWGLWGSTVYLLENKQLSNPYRRHNWGQHYASLVFVIIRPNCTLNCLLNSAFFPPGLIFSMNLSHFLWLWQHSTKHLLMNNHMHHHTVPIPQLLQFCSIISISLVCMQMMRSHNWLNDCVRFHSPVVFSCVSKNPESVKHYWSSYFHLLYDPLIVQLADLCKLLDKVNTRNNARPSKLQTS